MTALNEQALEAAYQNFQTVTGEHLDEHVQEAVQDAIRAYMAALDPAPGWQDMSSAPSGETCFFWLDWADDCKHLNPPLTDPNLAFFVGKKGHWASIYKGMWWQPAPPLPSPPRQAGDHHGA